MLLIVLEIFAKISDRLQARSVFFTTTLPFFSLLPDVISCKMTSGQISSGENHSGPWKRNRVCNLKEVTSIRLFRTGTGTGTMTMQPWFLTSLYHIQSCRFTNASVGTSEEDCFPIQSDLTPTHSSFSQPPTQSHYACSLRKINYKKHLNSSLKTVCIERKRPKHFIYYSLVRAKRRHSNVAKCVIELDILLTTAVCPERCMHQSLICRLSLEFPPPNSDG